MVRELKRIGMRKEVPKSEGVSMLMGVEKIVNEKSRKKSQEVKETKKVRLREVFPCDGGEGAVQNGSTTRTEQYSR